MAVYLQQHSSTVASIRLPASMASAQVVNGIEASISHLRSWVLLGKAIDNKKRQQAWADQINPAMTNLEALTRDNELGSLAALREKIEQLKQSQLRVEDIATKVITTRQSDDWNHAQYILRTETAPLATEIKNTLIALQEHHYKLLQEDVARNALISRVGSIATLAMIFVLGLFAWWVARTNSNRIVAPIEALAKASDQLVNVEDPPVQLRVEGPREIAYLTERFNHMSRELTARTKDLQHANRELQAYTHIITHDLKAPLINIKGHAGLIKTQLQELEAIVQDETASEQSVREAVLRTVTEDIPDSVKFIDLSITKTNTLVGGVLDNSRLLFRNIALEDVDMNNLVKQVVSLFSHRFDDVEFCCESLPVVRTDPFLMEHVFSNLIDNAVKYLDANRAGQIDIDGETRDGEAHFSVRDNGIGLDAAAIDVFMLFAQADTNNKGAGVGLALVQTMLAKLGGRIRHQSNAEHGTTFMFCVPLYHEKPN